ATLEAIKSELATIDNAERFAEKRKQLEQALPDMANALAKQVSEILALHHALRVKLKGRLPLSMIEAAREIAEQLDGLVYQGFVWHTPGERLADLPRYLKAAEKRLEKIERHPDRDRLLRVQFMPLVEKYREIATRPGIDPEQIDNLRWQLEELRVALFAQELGTRESVSLSKLDKQLNQI
ncbi:MAG TPA: DUF3418 domain-containing protein, partial [Halothiobacillus sp.]|nr:DUF3418 domain-containing protein [Halothiobacillus sp.]